MDVSKFDCMIIDKLLLCQIVKKIKQNVLKRYRVLFNTTVFTILTAFLASFSSWIPWVKDYTTSSPMIVSADTAHSSGGGNDDNCDADSPPDNVDCDQW